ncbi:hypothetical protein PanWU01x14_031240 [Parasponia andersonii]|uniref:Uncharacterized protein n=1 Tax=Parasponia andersonii TaxID=3476 RepID=A0A2P5DU44_PARAD|nr:hypothetical protein PanWU01x14_031240 [Parasponia andersonii]
MAERYIVHVPLVLNIHVKWVERLSQPPISHESSVVSDTICYPSSSLGNFS